MSDTTGLRAKEIFLAALEREPGERAAFVEQACAGEDALRARVEELLAAHQRADALDRVMARRRGRRRAGEAHEPLCFGDYELESELASGAMGTVYRARQLSLGRHVALKMLRVGRFASEGEVRRFRAEAEAVARLDHPGIVPVYEVGEHEGRHFFSMKLVDGPSLETAGERYRDPRAAARLVATIARAVHHAHQHGVLHRDLKPSNILLDAGGNPYVADFGIAKRIGEERGEATDTGWICGTPTFMAPEQAEAGGDVTVASDVYSLGSLLHTLVAGRPPFAAERWVEVLRKLREEEPPPLRSAGGPVDRDLATIVRQCLAKEPARRYASARALAEDLERWLEHLPIAARPASLLERARLAYRRRPLTTALAAAVAFLLLLLAAGATASALLLGERLERAQSAEAAAKERLRGALLAQARSLRLGLQPGRRTRGLSLLEQAAVIRPGPDLRDEAITCLSARDLGPLRAWPREPDVLGLICADPREGRLAVGRADGRLTVHEPDGALAVELPATRGLPRGGVFSRDGRLLLVKYHDEAGQSAHFVLWDLETGLARFDRPGLVYSRALDIDPRNRWAAVGLRGELRVLDAGTGELVRRVEVETWPTYARFRPDGARLAFGVHLERSVELLDPASGAREVAVAELPDELGGLDWSRGGELLAVGCHDFRVYLYRAPGFERVHELRGHQAEVAAVFFGGDDVLASYSWDETSRLWDVESGEPLVVAEAVAAGFTSDGRRLAFAGYEELGWWRLEGEDALAVLHGHTGKSPVSVAADPRGRWLATGGADGVIVREPRGGRVLARLPGEFVEGLAFTPEGDGLWSSGETGLELWPLPAALDPERGAGPRRVLEGACRRISASADGRVVAAVRPGDRVDVLRDADREGASDVLRLGPIVGLDNPAVSPDGRLVAVGSWHGSGARVWDVRTGELLRELLLEEKAVQPGFSPDGQLLVLGTRAEYRLLRVADWGLARVVERPERVGNLPGALAFDADGTRLGLAQTNRSVVVVDPRTGAALAQLTPAEPQQVSALAFLPDGDLAVAANTRRTLLWRLGAIARALDERGL